MNLENRLIITLNMIKILKELIQEKVNTKSSWFYKGNTWQINSYRSTIIIVRGKVKERGKLWHTTWNK